MTQKCTSYKRHGMSQFTCCFAWFILLIFLIRDLIWDFFQASALSRYRSRWPWLSNAGTVPSCSLNVYDKVLNFHTQCLHGMLLIWWLIIYFPNISKSHFRDVRIWLIIQIPKSNYYPNFPFLSTALFFLFFFYWLGVNANCPIFIA